MAPAYKCEVEFTLDLIGGRWKVMILYWLLQTPQRFNQLQRELGKITHRTLATQLREMEADGLVERRDFRENPPHVEYALTARGRSLEPVLRAMHDWASENLDEQIIERTQSPRMASPIGEAT